MKYTKVKQLIKMLEKQDPEADLFIEALLPKEFKNMKNLFVNLSNPTLYDPYTDINGSKHVWLSFKSKLEQL